MFARLAFRNKRALLGKGAIVCLCAAAAYPIMHQRKTACEEEDRKGWSLENVDWPELKTEEDTDDLVFVEIPESEESASSSEAEVAAETVPEQATIDAPASDDQIVSEPESNSESASADSTTVPAAVVEEEEDDEDDAAWLEEKSKCAFCKMFIFSPCKKHFKKWSNCVDKAKEEEKDFAQVCSEYTRGLMECTSEHTEFFKALSSEESAEEEHTTHTAAPTPTEPAESPASETVPVAVSIEEPVVAVGVEHEGEKK